MSIMENAEDYQQNEKYSYFHYDGKYSYFQSDGIYLQSLVQFFQSVF